MRPGDGGTARRNGGGAPRLSPRAAALLWLGLFACYARCAAPTFAFEDGPELLACAATLGNTHPPGYALPVLAGRLALLLPAGSPGYRLNLLGAACAAGAAAVLGWMAARLAASAWAGFFAAAAWGLSDTFWWEAGIGDKYAPFYLAFVALLAAGAGAAAPGGLPRLGLAAGAGLACHLYAAFALPLAGFVLLRPRAATLRRLALGAALAGLAASPRALFPPLRAQGAAALDWGSPRTAARLAPYLGGRLYHRAFASTSLAVNRRLWTGRLAQAWRFLAEEIPPPLLAAAPLGAGWLALAHPRLAAGLAACAAANAAYAMNFSEKVVRWYEPAYAVTVLFAALGFAAAAWRIRSGARWMALLAVLAAGWQAQRGGARNDLSRFTAAHDFARNLARAFPPGTVYLGAGDFDLFPLWGLRFAEGERTDVEAVGLASFVDPALAGAGNQRRFLARRGLPPEGAPALAALLSAPGGPPVRVATAGYERALVEAMPFLPVHRAAGLAGEPRAGWDPAGSHDSTRRVVRAWTLRGLVYARGGALGDLARLRDEVARGALLQYPASFAALGRECATFGFWREAAWAYGRARRTMAALAGPLPRAAPGAGEAAAARAERLAVAAGYARLADAHDARGITFLAVRLRENAAAVAR